jgi:maleate isomerase
VTDRVRLGMLTPSSNTVLEPVTAAMVAEMPEVSMHFGRFRVTEISLGARALAQFDDEKMLQAAALLGDARVKTICWNGTSAGWLGFDADRALCAAIERHTGIAACSSVLSLAEIFRRTGVERFGLVTPYVDEVQARIIATFRAEGFECIAERHLGISDNFSFSEIPAARLTTMVREVAAAKPRAITIFCTNLRGAPLVEGLERDIGVPIYDTIATGLWGALRLSGADPRRIRSWGRLFRDIAP